MRINIGILMNLHRIVSWKGWQTADIFVRKIHFSIMERERVECVFIYLIKVNVKPSDEYVAYLMTQNSLMFIDEIDCQDMFSGNDPREKILIFEII